MLSEISLSEVDCATIIPIMLIYVLDITVFYGKSKKY